MLKPIRFICDSIQYYTQKFVLHMLDHYGILVSRWAWILIMVSLGNTLYSLIMVPLSTGQKIEPLGLGISMVINFVLYNLTSKQVIYEKEGNLKRYEVGRLQWDQLFYKSFFVLLLIGFAIPREVNNLLTEVTLIGLVKFFYQFFAFLLPFFGSCYTRDREPPAKTSLSFAN